MGSKKKTGSSPVKYYATFEQVICMAPADAIVEIKINDEVAYNKPITESQIFSIDAPNLFGGDKSEGGVSGSCEARFGYPLQDKSEFLSDKTDELYSANRGVLSVVAKDFYMGQSPYAKPWHFRVKSTLLNYDYTDNWYREKATIAHDGSSDSSGSKVVKKFNTGKYWRVSADHNTDQIYGYNTDTAGEFAELSGGQRMMWHHFNAADLSVVQGGDLQVVHSRRSGSSNPYGGISYSEVSTPVKVLMPLQQNLYYDCDTYGTHTAYTNSTAIGELTSFVRPIVSVRDVSHNKAVWIMRRPNNASNVIYDYCLGSDESRETGHFGRDTVYQTNKGNMGTGANADGKLIFSDGTCVFRGSASGSNYVIEGYKYVNRTITAGYGTTYYASQNTIVSGDTVLAFAIDSENSTGYLLVKNDGNVYLRIINNKTQTAIENVTIGAYSTVLPYAEESECYFVMSHDHMVCFCGTYAITMLRKTAASETETVQLDYNPIHAVYEAITSKVWGLGKDPSVIDDANFRAAADVCWNEELGISFVFESDDKVADFIDDVMRIAGGTLRIDRATGLVQVKLFRADYDADDLLVFDSDNVLEIKDVKRTALSECVNQVTVKYTNCETGEDASLVYQDLALLQQQGEPINADFDYPYVHWKDTAVKLAQRDLYENASQFLSCSVTAGLQARMLNLGDCIVLDFPHLGIENNVFRIMKINYGGSDTNNVQMELVQDKFSYPVSSGYTSGGTPVIRPPVITRQFDFVRLAELPYYVLYKLGKDPDAMLADNTAAGRLGVLVSAYNTVRTDSAEEYLTADGNTFAYIGSVDKKDFVPSCAAVNDIDYLTTSFKYEKGSNLDSVRVDQGRIGFIDDEIVGIGVIDPYYRTVEISRGLFDTVPAKHAAGSVLYIAALDNDTICNDDEFTGGEIYQIKVAPMSANVMPDLSAMPSLEIGFTARCLRPYPLANVKIDSVYFPEMQNVDWYYRGRSTWNNRNRLTQLADDYLLWTDAVNAAVETDVTYKYSVSNRFGSIYSVSSFSPSASYCDIIVPCDIEEYAIIELWAERDSVECLQKIRLEGELQDLIMNFGINLTTGQLTVVMNTRNPTVFEMINGEIEVTTPSDYHTVYSIGSEEDAGYLIRTYEV